MTALRGSGRGGEFRAAVRAEWSKFRTVRGWLIGLVLAGLAIIGFSYLQAHGKHTGSCTTPNPNRCVAGHPFVPTGPGGEAVADTYRFVARTFTGNGTITARITSLTGRVAAGPANQAPSAANTRPGLAAWAKAGLLLTSSPRQGSAYAAVMATGGHGVRFQDDYTHDLAGLPGSIAGTSPRWLRLTRTGDTITGYDSTNGTTWQQLGSAKLSGLPSTVDVGLFATSPVTYEGTATQVTGHFDHVSIDPNVEGEAATGQGGWLDQSIGTGAHDSYITLGRGGYRHSGGSIAVSGSGDIAPAVPLVWGDTPRLIRSCSGWWSP